jgi:hypothetical protein
MSGEYFGIKGAVAAAGFAGGVVSLSYMKQLTPLQATLAVMTGTATASYLTPVAVHYWQLPAALENGVGFLLGLCAMHIIPAAIRASEAFTAKWGSNKNE